MYQTGLAFMHVLLSLSVIKAGMVNRKQLQKLKARSAGYIFICRSGIVTYYMIYYHILYSHILDLFLLVLSKLYLGRARERFVLTVFQR